MQARARARENLGSTLRLPEQTQGSVKCVTYFYFLLSIVYVCSFIGNLVLGIAAHVRYTLYTKLSAVFAIQFKHIGDHQPNYLSCHTMCISTIPCTLEYNRTKRPPDPPGEPIRYTYSTLYRDALIEKQNKTKERRTEPSRTELKHQEQQPKN